MHTTEIQGYNIHHNGDYSGDVTIVNPNGSHASVPFDVLVELVANFVRYERVNRLESSNPRDILGLK